MGDYLGNLKAAVVDVEAAGMMGKAAKAQDALIAVEVAIFSLAESIGLLQVEIERMKREGLK